MKASLKTAWILNHYAVMPDEPGSTRHFHLARAMRANGWQAHIIASSFGHWNKVQRISGHGLFSDREVDSVHFRFIRNPAYYSNGVMRVLNMLAFFLFVLLPRGTSGLPAPKVIVGSSVHPFAALAGGLLARRHRVPFVFEIRDLWPETLVQMKGMNERGVVARLLYRLEGFILKMADRVIVLLPDADQYLASKGYNKQLVHWIPNGVEIEELKESESDPASLSFMYLGAHGEANDLYTMLEAIRLYQQQQDTVEVEFRFVGEGPAKFDAMRWADKHQLTNVHFENAIPKQQVPAMLARADACMVAVRDIPGLYRFGISLNKIYDYMAAGKPVLASLSASNNPVSEAGAGLSSEAGRADLLAQSIQQFTRLTREERREMGQCGRDYVCRQHDYAVLAQKFALLLDELCVESVPGVNS